MALGTYGGDKDGSILLVGFDFATNEWLRVAIGDIAPITICASGSEAVALLALSSPSIVIVGDALAPGAAAAFLASLAVDEPLSPTVLYVIRRGGTPPPTSDIYFFLKREMSPADVSSVIKTALATRRTESVATTSPKEAAELARLLEVPRRFGAQRTLRGASRVATSAILEFIKAERAECLFYDSDDGSLWTEGDDENPGGREGAASSGLVGFAALTNKQICLERADADARYSAELDNPSGRVSDRLLVQPLSGTDRKVHAVLVATRRSKEPPFSADDRRVCAWLATQLAPLTAQLAMKVEAELVLEDAAAEKPALFRREAAEANARAGVRGDVVRVSPKWIGWTYWLLVLILAAAAFFAIVTDINEYSNGPFIVQQSGRTDVISPIDGNVATVHVKTGDVVSRGQLLATFRSPEESSQLERIDGEWQAALRRYLVNRADLDARTAVSTIRNDRERLVDKLAVRALSSSVVRDVRVSEGQSIRQGQTVLTLARKGGTLSIVAVLPGADQPLLQPGMSLRAELSGYRDGYLNIEISDVSEEVIGPAEASLVLGKQLAGVLDISGPVVLIRADLDQPTFTADGKTYELSHGMTGRVDVRLRAQNLLRTLVPGFKK